MIESKSLTSFSKQTKGFIKMTDAIQPRKVSGKPKSTRGSMLSAPTTDVALTSDKSVKTEEKEPDNPFHMPSDNDIFFLRDKERQRRKEERARMRALKPHEKTTSVLEKQCGVIPRGCRCCCCCGCCCCCFCCCC